ncbi:MAG: RNA polymerase sigma factor region1.1 domain-containing protein, partial [Candidatus Puniceispirillales bacterium]
MAQKAQNKKQTTAKATEAANDTGSQEEAVIVDSHVEAIQRLLKSGKERGFVTHDELNAAL